MSKFVVALFCLYFLSTIDRTRAEDTPPDVSYAATVCTLGKAITVTPVSSGGTVDSYANVDTLPLGLALDSSTGIISGKPKAITSETRYTISASNSAGTVNTSIDITVVNALPSVQYTDRKEIIGYHVHVDPFSIGGAVDSYVLVDTLPLGLELDNSTGIISGVPTVITSKARYAITATNSAGTVNTSIDITIVDVVPILEYPKLGCVMTIGQPMFIKANLSGGAVTGYNVSWLPDGISLNNVTFDVSGVATILLQSTQFHIIVFNSGGSWETTFPMDVVDVGPSAQYANHTFTVGEYESLSPVSSGGFVTLWELQSKQALPDGLSLDKTTGVISGTAQNTVASRVYVIRAYNSGGHRDISVSIAVSESSSSSVVVVALVCAAVVVVVAGVVGCVLMYRRRKASLSLNEPLL